MATTTMMTMTRSRVTGPVETMGDVDCDVHVDSVDALKILRHVASLSAAQSEPCRDVGP
jgi:hypothetical protein